MKLNKNNSLLIFAALILVGIICLILENTFYQYVDENGYLHESLFLPIGAISLILGSLGVVVLTICKLIAYMRSS